MRALHKKETETRERLERELSEIPKQLKKQEELVAFCRYDVEYLKENSFESFKEDKKDFGERLMSSISEHEFESEEYVFGVYQGFEIVIPAIISTARPYIYIRRVGSYFLELGSSASGNIQRIDNFISGLPAHLEKLKNSASILRKNRKTIKEELSRKFGYAEEIEITLKRLEALDKELGVDKK